MKKLKYACLLGCCLALAACSSARQPKAENLYLTRYLPSASDSATGKQNVLQERASELNRERLHEAVDPEGEGSWGDILRNVIIYYRRK